MIPKYAKLENERRFLVRPEALARLRLEDERLIEDLYVADSRLRLRRITRPDRVEHKLCKKYESADPASGPIVNVYLSAAEHRALSQLPGRRIAKRRYDAREGGLVFGVNLFLGELEGLVLAEIEVEALAELGRIPIPPWVEREVTAEPFFAGGALAALNQADLRARLSAEG